MSAIVDCAERERMADVLRVATHELAWALQEEFRLLGTGDLDGADHMATVIQLGQKHRRDAAAALRRHILGHRCTQQSSVSGG